MKKLLLALLVCFSSAGVFGQEFSTEDKQLILDNKDFFLINDIMLNDYQFDNDNLNIALRKAIVSKKKKTTNGIVGGVFLGLGAACLIGGIVKGQEPDPITALAKTPSTLGLIVNRRSFNGSFYSFSRHSRAEKKRHEKILDDCKRVD